MPCKYCLAKNLHPSLWQQALQNYEQKRRASDYHQWQTLSSCLYSTEAAFRRCVPPCKISNLFIYKFFSILSSNKRHQRRKKAPFHTSSRFHKTPLSFFPACLSQIKRSLPATGPRYILSNASFFLAYNLSQFFHIPPSFSWILTELLAPFFRSGL